jgi:hypothetical protein
VIAGVLFPSGKHLCSTERLITESFAKAVEDRQR